MVETKKISFIKRIWRFIFFKRRFEVVEDYFLWAEKLKKFIFIPAGFIYDGASVPKILGMIYSPVGVLFLGSCPHDFGYKHEVLFLVDPDTGEIEERKMTKKEHDDLFDYLCTLESGMDTASGLARNSLAILSIPVWNKYRRG